MMSNRPRIKDLHYTLDEENSERLMLKYYTYLFKIRILLKDKYGLELLRNLEKFPLRTDPKLKEYYTKIAGRIKRVEEIKSM